MTDLIAELSKLRRAGNRTLTIQERSCDWLVTLIDHDTWQKADSGPQPTLADAATIVIEKATTGALDNPYRPGGAA